MQMQMQMQTRSFLVLQSVLYVRRSPHPQNKGKEKKERKRKKHSRIVQYGIPNFANQTKPNKANQHHLPAYLPAQAAQGSRAR